MLPKSSKIGNIEIGNNIAKRGKLVSAMFFFLMCFFTAPLVQAENGFITFYQKHISAVDGNRCPMVPSCSTYASRAIEKHGLLMGWVLSCDRLVRCGRDEAKVSASVVVNHQEYTHDPVDANDFWWFENDNKQ